MNTPEIGDAVTFIPAAFTRFDALPGSRVSLKGRVISVNREHGHFTVEGACGAYRIRESFRIVGPSPNVTILGGLSNAKSK